MAYQKLQPERAIQVIPHTSIPVPDPALEVISGEADTYTGPAITNPFQDDNATFVTSDVKVGDIVFNTTDKTITQVAEVVSETVLRLDDAIMANGETYAIYRYTDKSACLLYVGGAGNVGVTTIGGDQVIFYGVPAGTFIPVQVTNVGPTGVVTATDIIALR
jgi:hypothetical protein